ncbi:hypothetical protein NL676_001830 [Syzygium grande]|nr:hypothetical protein NL676_001830 [Syzygium grande]
MSGRRGGCCFSRCGFSSRPPRNTTQVRPVAVPPQPVVVPLSSESELVPCFEGEQAMGEQNPTSWKYTWKITNFTSLTQKKYYSEVFTLCDNAWRILIFPKGNNTDHLSIYLDVANSVELPYGWNRSAHFRMTLVDQNNYSYSRIKETEHNFNARESDWGFTSFIPLSERFEGRTIPAYKPIDAWRWSA